MKVRTCLIGLMVMLWAESAAATMVMLMSLGNGRADVLINESVVRSLREGQPSPEGVNLVSTTRNTAVFEIEGARYSLTLGQTAGSEVILNADAQGHFYATALLNGVPVRAMIDTGASTVSLNRVEAARIGLDYQRGPSGIARTANGSISVRRAMLGSVQIGGLIVRNVEASVSSGDASQLHVVLLGNSFLNHVNLQRSGSRLILTRR